MYEVPGTLTCPPNPTPTPRQRAILQKEAKRTYGFPAVGMIMIQLINSVMCRMSRNGTYYQRCNSNKEHADIPVDRMGYLFLDKDLYWNGEPRYHLVIFCCTEPNGEMGYPFF